ncbi:MAG TPA: ComF family protein [Gammaproteobacteria bacterium]
MSAASRFVAALARVCFAERCPSCGGSTDGGFCEGCRGGMPAIPLPCATCGLPRPVGRCPRESSAWHVDRIVAPFEYAPPIDGFLQALKFGQGRMLGRALALLVEPDVAARAADETRNVDLLVPVPLHRRRLLARGYNQATEIARTLSSALRIPLAPAAARRTEAAAPQSRLRARERAANVEHAFAVDVDLTGARVAIVDDVITTGATVNALAAELRRAGAVRVEAWAVARTVRSPRSQAARPRAERPTASPSARTRRVDEAGAQPPPGAAARNT